jgi:hypothetical protein
MTAAAAAETSSSGNGSLVLQALAHLGESAPPQLARELLALYLNLW